MLCNCCMCGVLLLSAVIIIITANVSPLPLILVAPVRFLLLTVPSNVLDKAIAPHGNGQSKCRMYSAPRLWTRAMAAPPLGDTVVAVPTRESVCHFPLALSLLPPSLPLSSHPVAAFLSLFPLPIFLSCRHHHCWRCCHHHRQKIFLLQSLIPCLLLFLAHSWPSPLTAIARCRLHGSQCHPCHHHF